jgi:hypothetical protein
MNTRMQCFWAFHELLRWSIELVVWVSILPLRCACVGQKWRAMLIAIERLNDSFCPSVRKGITPVCQAHIVEFSGLM